MASSLLLGACSSSADSALKTTSIDPFEVSKKNCETKTGCITTNENYGEITIQQWMDQSHISLEMLRYVNGWGEEVTPKTVIPIGATFSFA